ncbi:hypothetical protein QE152_g1916 [Popillia japonica]|uniref:Uncharacterized protein n=1 Tax=Popillia japonica TaxID=7064 RepID=A0AAW1N2T2_POPJA
MLHFTVFLKNLSALVNGFRLLEEPLYWLKSHYNRNDLKVDCVPFQYLSRLGIDESIQETEEVNNLPATQEEIVDKKTDN